MAYWLHCEQRAQAGVQRTSSTSYSAPYLQTVKMYYRIEWWENFALPNDSEVLSTYEQSWEECTILDGLTEEYVCDIVHS